MRISHASRHTGTTSLLQFRTHGRKGQHRGRLASLLQRKNKGLEARIKRDDDSGRVEVSDEERTAILERKAKMYTESQATPVIFQTHPMSTSSVHLGSSEKNAEPSRPTLGTSRRDARVNMILQLEKETQDARDQARERKEHAVQERERIRAFWRRQYITRMRQRTQPE
eukprot:CAMPEP_0118797688 /NCGR_PEP_ID=MMETSP1161-20130426/202_1 /TAXON_ID=249345 /ORGANISM="Picochlorum oklahomensis, Strain CCMP2329" /LENGTH=168 /DNA_ID=CAMNT_0006724899 /DNA_START=185 /DNA_END=691 /DNA_ORIENTATION=-